VLTRFNILNNVPAGLIILLIDEKELES
jgi:hypothetical protein